MSHRGRIVCAKFKKVRLSYSKRLPYRYADSLKMALITKTPLIHSSVQITKINFTETEAKLKANEAFPTQLVCLSQARKLSRRRKRNLSSLTESERKRKLRSGN